ncbi:hypothetical protein [Micromonospora endolithica]|uniref:Uncharacterized protein n=1 Tax=Micromonospora endolithica TaxID=230091 RepID=A0A3A9ZKH8_9ACTN|nr:hypothetical protein [Micromonospora endolithica]RKN48364.1 hypothetical protein D7223_10165 [Micromonospora endolithica]
MTPAREPVSDEERERAARAVEQLKRDLAAASDRPAPRRTDPEKFTDPVGLDRDGNYQRPLDEQERAHRAEVRRRAAEDSDGR